MEHSVHLGAEKFIKGVAPSTGRAILQKVRQAFRNAQDGATYNLDQLNASLKECEDDPEGDGGNGEDENEEDFDAGDACGKALALIKQVGFVLGYFAFKLIELQIRKSPQARAFFTACCEEVEVPLLQLLLWVKTRWASLYNFLDHILVLRKVEIIFSTIF